MSREAPTTPADEVSQAEVVPLVDRVAFFALLAVLCARPLISESFARLSLPFVPPNAPNGTTPATTVWLDGILLLGVALVWIRRWQSGISGGPRWPRTLSIGLGALLAAVVVSTWAAHEKRLAANAGANMFVLTLTGATLWRLMRARWMAHLLIAALVAGGVTNAAKCITQRSYEFDYVLEYWEEQKPTRIAAGVDPNSPAIVNYERRLRSGEAYGHLFHPNVTGSYLGLSLLVAAGLLIGAVRRGALDASRKSAAALVAVMLAGVLGVGLYLTGSAGAAGSAALAGLVLLLFGAARERIARHVRGVFVLLIMGYATIIAAGGGYGLLTGTLPHPSLAFRWEYWQAAARTVRDAPWTGVGRENFREEYLRYKSAASTEEVSNPHNLWLTLMAELGPLGLIAGFVLTGIAGYAALRGVGQFSHRAPAAASVYAVITAAVGVLLVQAVFSGERFSAPGIPLLWATLVAGVWVLAFLSTYYLVSLVDERRDGAGWLVVALGAALLAALVHNLIGFSLFTPAGLAVFVGLAAAGAALQTERTEATDSAPLIARRGSRARRAVPAVLSVVLAAAYFYTIASPTIRSEAALLRAQVATWSATDVAGVGRSLWQGLNASAEDEWDAEVPRTLADMALQLASANDEPDDLRQAWLEAAHRYAAVALGRDQSSFGTWQIQAQLATAEAESEGSDKTWALAVRAWEVAVALYPTNPRTRISAGRAWFALCKLTGSRDDGRNAVRHFQAALIIDATRPSDVAAKLRSQERQVVHQYLDELYAAGFASAGPPSMPSP
jgi:hypothetical protein